MNKSSAVIYKGWTITAMCLRHADPHSAGPDTYTGRVISFLNDTEGEASWADTGPQISNIICRVFLSFDACAQALLTEARARIDTLALPGSSEAQRSAALRQAVRSHAVNRARDAVRRCPAAIPDIVLSHHAVLSCMRRPVRRHPRIELSAGIQR